MNELLRFAATLLFIATAQTPAHAAPPHCTLNCDTHTALNCTAEEARSLADCPQPPSPPVVCEPVECPAAPPAPTIVCRHKRNNCSTSRTTGKAFCRRCRVYFP